MSSKDKFSSVFKEEFDKLISSGVSRSEAAATAIKLANERLHGSVPASKRSKSEVVEEENIADNNIVAIERTSMDNKLIPFSVEVLSSKLQSASETGSYQNVIKFIQSCFSSLDRLVETFAVENSSPNCKMDVSSVCVDSLLGEDRQEKRIDLDQVYSVFQLVVNCNNREVKEVLYSCLDNASRSILDHSGKLAVICGDPLDVSIPLSSVKGFTPLNHLIPFLVLLEFPDLNDPKHMDAVERIFRAIDTLPESLQQILSEWWGLYAGTW